MRPDKQKQCNYLTGDSTGFLTINTLIIKIIRMNKFPIIDRPLITYLTQTKGVWKYDDEIIKYW